MGKNKSCSTLTQVLRWVQSPKAKVWASAGIDTLRSFTSLLLFPPKPLKPAADPFADLV